MRDQPTVAATLGIPTMRVRIVMFVLGSSIGAFAGSLFVHGRGFAQPAEFSVELGLGIFVMLIVGGIESLWGPILGAAFYVWVPHVLKRTRHQSVRQPDPRVQPDHLRRGVAARDDLRARGSHRDLPPDQGTRLQHRSVERKQRTWLSDFFGITKPPLVEVPVTADDADDAVAATDARGARPGRGCRARPSPGPPSSRRPTSASPSVACAPSTA